MKILVAEKLAPEGIALLEGVLDHAGEGYA